MQRESIARANLQRSSRCKRRASPAAGSGRSGANGGGGGDGPAAVNGHANGIDDGVASTSPSSNWKRPVVRTPPRGRKLKRRTRQRCGVYTMQRPDGGRAAENSLAEAQAHLTTQSAVAAFESSMPADVAMERIAECKSRRPTRARRVPKGGGGLWRQGPSRLTRPPRRQRRRPPRLRRPLRRRGGPGGRGCGAAHEAEVTEPAPRYRRKEEPLRRSGRSRRGRRRPRWPAPSVPQLVAPSRPSRAVVRRNFWPRRARLPRGSPSSVPAELDTRTLKASQGGSVDDARGDCGGGVRRGGRGG